MGLIDKIGGKGLVAGAMLGASVLCSGCNAHLSPYGRSFGRSLVESGAREAVVGGVRNEVEGPRGTTVNVGNSETRVQRAPMSMEDNIYLNWIHSKPRVFKYQINSDGSWVWAYRDGKGGLYNAGYTTTETNNTFDKNDGKNKSTFERKLYYIKDGERIDAPEGTLEILYTKPGIIEEKLIVK